jgi:hypothetical protein
MLKINKREFGKLSKFRLGLLAPVFIALVVAVPRATAVADTLPTGEVTLGQTTIEPAYNDIDGTIIYLLTPNKAHENANAAHAVAPLYLIMYPTSAGPTIGTVNCQHQPMDNCPDHGPAVAGLAEAHVPSVYGAGVWGHDHLVAAPPSPPAAGDFNIAWVPVVVLFNDLATASTHVTTIAQLNALITANLVTLIPLPAATFHCSVTAVATYRNGTPVTPAPPLP